MKHFSLAFLLDNLSQKAQSEACDQETKLR